LENVVDFSSQSRISRLLNFNLQPAAKH